MRPLTFEFSTKMASTYALLSVILKNVGLEDNRLLSSLIKYFSLGSAIFEVMEEEFNSLYFYASPYVSNYAKEIFTKQLYYLKNNFNHYSYNEKITSLCNKDINILTQEHQKKILNKVCTEHSTGNYTKDQLFATSQDNFKAICIILGDQELCSEVLL